MPTWLFTTPVPEAFEYVRLKAYYKQTVSEQWVKDVRESQRRPLAQPSVPVRGLAHVGHVVMKADGTGHWACTQRTDTRLSSDASSGAFVVNVNDAAGMVAQDVLAVCLNDRTTHWTRVSAVAGNAITLEHALTSSASAGGQVAAVRWLAAAYTV